MFQETCWTVAEHGEKWQDPKFLSSPISLCSRCLGLPVVPALPSPQSLCTCSAPYQKHSPHPVLPHHTHTLRWPGLRREEDGVRNTVWEYRQVPQEKTMGESWTYKAETEETQLFCMWGSLAGNATPQLPFPKRCISPLRSQFNCTSSRSPLPKSSPEKCSQRGGTRTALYSWVGCILHNGLSSSLPTVTPDFGRRECLLFFS